jgi:hypothetical protein
MVHQFRDHDYPFIYAINGKKDVPCRLDRKKKPTMTQSMPTKQVAIIFGITGIMGIPVRSGIHTTSIYSDSGETFLIPPSPSAA